ARAVGGVVVRMGSPGVVLNPLDLPIHHTPNGGPRAHPDVVRRRALFIDTFVSVLLRMELDPITRAVLDDACTTPYTRARTPPHPAPWPPPPPPLPPPAAALPAPPAPPGPTLAAQLRPYPTGAWSGLFNGPTTTPTATSEAARLVSWSLRELPDELHAPATLL